MTGILRRLAAALVILTLPCAAFAHPIDEYLQATLVSIKPDLIRLDINLTPGTAVADKILAVINPDHCGVITTNEARAYVEILKRDLTARLDQREIKLTLTQQIFPDEAELRTGWGIIQLQFTADTEPLANGAHALALQNRHMTNISAYLVNAAMPDSTSVQITRQNRNNTQSESKIEFTVRQPPDHIGVFGMVATAAALSAGVLAWPRRKPRDMAGRA